GAFLCRRRGRHRIWVSAWSSDVCSADLYEELGSTDGPEIKDRMYFHSIYCRCPGGILVECAATAAGGFARDEPYDKLGTSLLLPPWFEDRRDEIVAMLEPIKVPESNQPATATPPGAQPS